MSGGVPEFVLPALRLSSRHPGMPRRYEETRPVVVQNNVHQRILDLGLGFEQRICETARQESEQMAGMAERALWETAMEQQREAVAAARSQAKAEHAAEMKRSRKEWKAETKVEIARLESRLRYELSERVTEARCQGNAQMEAATCQLEEKWQRQYTGGVETARREEREGGDSRVDAIMRQLERAAETERQRAEEKCDACLARLTAEKDVEAAGKVSAAVSVACAAAADRQRDTERRHDDELRQLRYQLAEQRANVVRERRAGASVSAQNGSLRADLAQLREQFERFVNTVAPFNSEFAAGFVMPPPGEYEQCY